MKKIFWLIIAIIIVLILAAVKASVLKKEKPVIEENTENALQVSVVPITQTDSFYNIQVEYPQFKGVNSDFNQKISGLILGEIDTFKKDAKDNWDARRATAPPQNPLPENPDTPFDFIATWTPTQLNNQYLSFVINIYYFSGGAHGLTEVDAFNYDVAKNKEITINDFLNSAQPALEKLSQLAAQEVTSQLEGNGVPADDNLKQMIQEGTKPTAENYANFNFDYNSLIIYFQQYQAAPGYIGHVTITLYKDTLTQNSITSNYLK